ncbi:MAG: hypothetical protein Q7U02_02800 [Desulfosalsimonadaceae bacterium]|nr:hypothetical protein [Desulfosalsimonadaceae bacterium]
MKSFIPLKSILAAAVIACLCLSGCEKKKEGKVEVTDKQFTIRKDGDFNWTIDATGKIRNTGETDLKNVVVTAYCRSCGEILVGGVWHISDVEKLPEQKDTINFLQVGSEEKFSISDVAFYIDQTRISPEGLPEKLEIVVESFETVDK